MSDDANGERESASEPDQRRRPPPRRRSALAWGAVGALGFLVLHQGYVLLGGEGVSLPAALGVAVGVFVAASVLSYIAEGALARRNESA